MSYRTRRMCVLHLRLDHTGLWKIKFFGHIYLNFLKVYYIMLDCLAVILSNQDSDVLMFDIIIIVRTSNDVVSFYQEGSLRHEASNLDFAVRHI